MRAKVKVGVHREGLMRTIGKRAKRKISAEKLERAVQEVLEERPELDSAEVELEMIELLKEEE